MEVGTSVRLDQWLNAACIFKTRTQASNACGQGRIKVNGGVAKAHRLIRIEDRIEVRRGDWPQVLVVKGLRDKPIAKAEARKLYQDVSPPRPRLDPIDRILRRPAVPREKGKGRPTKRERRQIDKLRRKT